LQHLETARTLDPKDKSAYSQLAVVYRRRGNPERAAAMLAALNALNDAERKEEGHRKRLRVTEEAPPETAQ
jgi:Flp pilus assembly protein TadD